MSTDVSAVTARGSEIAPGEKVPDEKERDQMAVEIGSGVMFFQKLARDGRSPEYFGKAVTPGQKDAVLVRWKTEDGQWRVIYGDLRAETLPKQ